MSFGDHIDVEVVPIVCLFITMKSEGTFLSPGHRSTECKQEQCYITVEGEFLILMATLLHYYIIVMRNIKGT